MTEFCFFYGINFTHRVYLLADSLSKALQWENISAVEWKATAEKTPENILKKTLENIRDKVSSNLFFGSINTISSKFDFTDGPILPTKRKNPNYKTMSKYFVKGGNSKEGKV